MIRRRSARTAVGVACVLVLASITLGCGGGGNGGGDEGPEFMADDPSPGPLTLSLGPGSASGSQFDVRVNVTGIQDFFGTGFRLTFDPAFSDFQSLSTTGSFITSGGATTNFDVFEIGSGVIDVVATREGSNLAGVDVGGTSLLVTLRFVATNVTTSPEPFVITTPRQIQVCPQAGQQCSMLDDGDVTWSGGSLVVN